jgi:peptidyl-prolyl cis-trans isomerase D
MISWIQRTFQHHFRTIFAILLALTIISFIFTIGASPGIGRGTAASLNATSSGTTSIRPTTSSSIFGDA